MRRIMHSGLGFLLAATLAMPQVQAQEAPVVIELYTSQGCSACPPADALMERLAGRNDVIALALHVDYWDYIGWTDIFARPEFTARQKGYAQAIGERSIYTPQMIVNGIDRVEGFRPMQVADLVGLHRERRQPVSLRLEQVGDQVRILISAEPPLPGEALVQLVRYKPEETVLIERGENAGRTVSYHNIVTLWETIARWDGQAPLEMLTKDEGEEPMVVIVQAPDHGPVLAAAQLD